MKKPLRLLIALLVLLAPLAARTLWFYQGFYQRSQPVATPDYVNLALPQPDLSTPAPVKAAADTARPMVLLDMYHGNYFYLSEVEKLTGKIERAGATIEIYNGEKSFTDQLKYAAALVVIAPTYSFYQTELRAIGDFIARGGRLLVITDPTRNYGTDYSSTLNSVEIANLLLAPYQISFNDDYIYNLVENEGNFRNVILTGMLKDPLTQGLDSVVLYSAHSLKTSQTALITADDNTLSSLTDAGSGLAVMASASQGQVVALGDFSFLGTPYDSVADNQVLIDNLTAFLTGGAQAQGLKTFPYLFSRDVTILVPESDPIPPDLLGAFSTAQSALDYLGKKASFASAPEDGKDLLVITNLPLGDEYSSYFEGFGLEFSKEPAPTATPEEFYEPSPTPFLIDGATPTPYVDEFGLYDDSFGYDSYGDEEEKIPMLTYVSVPGFGKLNSAGLGLVLFSPGEERNTLVLLTGNASDMPSLVGLLSSGYLTGCVVKENTAVCKLSSGSTGYGY